ncbi:VOC family protein [Desulfosporosinus sp. SRJS8]|nr:VOC family protein [Desulfosporosinus sp. SRJS8]
MGHLPLSLNISIYSHYRACLNTFPNTPYNACNNISFSLEFDTKEATKAMFEALSTDGQVEIELQESSFCPLYGKFTDKFGVMWQVSCKAK